MKEIRLSNGAVALVDDEDYENLAQYKWHALSVPSGTRYAARSVWDGQRVNTIYMHSMILATQPGYRDDEDGLVRKVRRARDGEGLRRQPRWTKN